MIIYRFRPNRYSKTILPHLVMMALIFGTAGPLAQAAERIPQSFQGKYGNGGFCYLSIKAQTVSGLFDGGGSCKAVRLRRVTHRQDPTTQGFQGDFVCFSEGTQWSTRGAIWRFIQPNNRERTIVTIVLNINDRRNRDVWVKSLLSC